jgi:hypothetical protein
MKTILVACEYSGVVRDAFENAGWDAWSCDLLPTESEQTKVSGKHIQGNIMTLLSDYKYECEIEDGFWTYRGWSNLPDKWDLLIGHPPCTFLSFAYTGKERYSNNRLQEKINAYQFFFDLWDASVEHICLENPMGYIHSGLLPCTQIVEPYYFGHDYRKKTCLWLKNLPLLVWSKEDNLFGKKTAKEPIKQFLDIGKSGKKYNQKEHVLPPYSTPKERSKFHTGIAAAMAEQWTEFLKQ